MEEHDDQNPNPDSGQAQSDNQFASGGQVMDVSAPTNKPEDTMPSSNPETTPDSQVPDFSNTPAQSDVSANPAPDTYTPSEAEAPSMNAVPSVSDAPMADTPVESPAPLETHQKEHHKGSAPIVAIIIAILVAIVLAGLVVYSYMKSRNNGDIKRSDSSQSTQTIEEKPKASLSDVDTTTKEIDSTLTQVDDSKDFTSTDLSDSSLGL